MQKLEKLFKNKCGYSYVDSISHNKICIPVAKEIMSIYKQTTTLDNDILSKYLQYLNSSAGYSQCHNKIEHRNMISILFDVVVPSVDNMKLLLIRYHSSNEKINAEIINILQKLLDRKITIPSEILCTAIKNNMKTVSEFLINQVEVNTECVEVACLHGYVELLPQMFGQKHKATTKALENLLQYYKGKEKDKKDTIIHQINLLFKYGAEPNKECLNLACVIKDKSVIEKFLTYKIKPDHKCFKALIGEAYYHKCKQQSKDADHIAELIDLLASNGYELTLDDVFDALKAGYYINNIKQYNFKIDKTFMEKCYKIGYFPYKDIEVKPDIELLRAECRKSGNLTNIKQLVRQGLEPDFNCLRDACSVGSNIGTIRYLIEVKKIDPDLQCIKNLADTLNSNSQLKLLLSHYNPIKDRSYVTPVTVNTESDSDDSDEEPKKKVIKPVKAVVKRAAKKKILRVDDDSISDDEKVTVTNKK